MRKESAAKEKEQKEAVLALEQIEAVRVLHFFYIFDGSFLAQCKKNSK